MYGPLLLDVSSDASSGKGTCSNCRSWWGNVGSWVSCPEGRVVQINWALGNCDVLAGFSEFSEALPWVVLVATDWSSNCWSEREASLASLPWDEPMLSLLEEWWLWGWLYSSRLLGSC